MLPHTTSPRIANDRHVSPAQLLHACQWVVAALLTAGQANPLVAQTFHRTIDTQFATSDSGDAVEPTFDGSGNPDGFVVAGTVASLMYLWKCDTSGAVLCKQTLGDFSGISRGFSVQQSADGGYIVAGETVFAANRGIGLMKTDSACAVIWQKTYAGTASPQSAQGPVRVREATPCGDGPCPPGPDYIVVGQWVDSTQHNHGVLLRTDCNGGVIFSKRYINTGVGFPYTIFTDVRQITDGGADDGFLVVGWVLDDTPQAHPLLIRTDCRGNVLWARRYNEPAGSLVDGLALEIAPNGYVIMGSRFDGSGNRPYLLKTDNNGGPQWLRTFGAPLLAYPQPATIGSGSVRLTADFGFVFNALEDVGGGSRRAAIVKTDPDGVFQWARSYAPPGAQSTEARYVAPTDDGGYVLTGRATLSGQDDVYLVKTDSAGDVCYAEAVNPVLLNKMPTFADVPIQVTDNPGETDVNTTVALSCTETLHCASPGPVGCPTLYAIDYDVNLTTLYRIDPVTGGPVPGSSPLPTNLPGLSMGLELGPDGFLYAVTTDGSAATTPPANSLYRINPYTGVAQLVGSLNGGPSGPGPIYEGDLAFRDNGALYGAHTVPGGFGPSKVYRINLTTGVATQLGVNEPAPVNISYLAYDSSARTLLALDIPPGGGGASQYSINPITGVFEGQFSFAASFDHVGGMDYDAATNSLFIADGGNLWTNGPLGLALLVGPVNVGTGGLSGLAFCYQCPPVTPSCPSLNVQAVYVGGHPDVYVAPLELADPRAALATFMNNNCQDVREFDEGGADQCFGHTFKNLPTKVIAATLEVRLMAHPNDLCSNDSISLEFNGTPFGWGRAIGTYLDLNGLDVNGLLPGCFNFGEDRTFLLDLAALPEADGTCTNLLPSINFDHALDLFVENDTKIDYAMLTVIACTCDPGGPDPSDTAGTNDNFAGPEPANNAMLVAAYPTLNWAPFDGFITPAWHVGHRFPSPGGLLPREIVAAFLSIRMKPTSVVTSPNDTLNIGWVKPSPLPGLPPVTATWSYPICGILLPPLPGVPPPVCPWGMAPQPSTTVTLDLSALPADLLGTTNVLGKLSEGFLDVWVEDSTMVDYMTLEIFTCDVRACCIVDEGSDPPVHCVDLDPIDCAAAGGFVYPPAVYCANVSNCPDLNPAGDLDGDGDVDVQDLILVILDWGCVGDECVGDATGDGQTNIEDLVAVILAWGS